MKYKLRLIWRGSVEDYNGALVKYIYKSDVIDLPNDAQAFQFPGGDKIGWMPQLIGGEWLEEGE